MRILKLILLFLILAAVFFESTPDIAVAAAESFGESIQVFDVTQQDLDGNGTPDVVVIDCAFATGRDRVIVYDQNEDMPSGRQWQEITDFRDDVWVFDAGSDGTAQLIVDFNMEGEQYAALVYDDLDGDGQVRYRNVGDQIIIEESSYWHVRVESEQAWTQPGEKMTFLIDGYDGLGYGVRAYMLNQGGGRDGDVDWQLDLGDKDEDGTIDYQLQWMISPFLVNLKYAGLHKTKLIADPTNHPPEPYEGAEFWPLLIDKNLVGGSYFDHSPAIAVDWEAGVIDQIGILGYPIEAGYHVFSRLPLEKHTLNTANWENPMAYYDMADDQDGWPELQVRFEVAVPYDPYFPSNQYRGKVETPNLEVNYSWDQDNDNRWDYKMNLGANYSIDEVVEFPDFSIKSVPYDEIIPWVKDRTWDVAMLVIDGRPSRDSEGMFGKGWMIHRGYADGERVEPSGVKDEYLMGFSDRPPAENYQDIQEGMRGEYSFQYFDTPRMYLSALDRQLHLYSAQSGVWNLGGGNYIRYANLDGDAYLDQWLEERDGMVVQQLNYAHGVFVYSGSGGVKVKQVNISPVLFEAQPPGNYEEWQRLEAQLQASQIDLSPADFTGMLDQFSGETLEISNAEIRSFRTLDEGFHFELLLKPGFIVSGSAGPDLSALVPGKYILTYQDGFTIAPFTSADISLVPESLRFDSAGLNALESVRLTATLENRGLQDLPALTVQLYAEKDGTLRFIGERQVDLWGTDLAQLDFSWTPPEAGDWLLHFVWEDGDSNVHGDQAFPVSVHQPELSSPLQIVELSSPAWPLAALLLALTALTAISLGMLALRKGARRA